MTPSTLMQVAAAVLVAAALTTCGNAPRRDERAPSGRGLDGPTAAGAPPADAAAAPEPAAGSPPPLVTAALDRFPGLSGTILFQSDRVGRPKIFTLDLPSGRLTQLTHGVDHRDEEPAWSPDGTRIAFGSTRAGGDFDIWMMNADGSNPVRLTDHDANEEDPTWAADGRSIVFTAERDGRGELYRVWIEDRRVERVTNSVDRVIMPSVSPDGRSVAYAAQTIMNFQIHVLDFETGATRRITGTPGGACRPAWSTDGREVAFVRLDTDPSRIEIVPASGGPPRILVNDRSLWSYYPDYHPQGGPMVISVSPEHHEGEDWDLALVDPAQPDVFVKLTEGAGNDRVPEWKPVK